jgi:hypothetical protein
MKQLIEIYKDTIIALQQIRIMQLQSEIRNKEIISKLERMC